MLSGWSYRKTIAISPATGIANLQVKVVLTTTNFNYSLAKANGDDLRFTDTSDTLLDYWIETWNASGDSTIWVEVTDSGTSSIYLYFGNSSASAVSSGANTFIQFDDFSGDLSDWTTGQNSGTPTWAITGGKARVTSDSAQNVQMVQTIPTTETEYIVHTNITAQDGLTAANYQQGISLRTATSWNPDYFRWNDIVTTWDKWDIQFAGISNSQSSADTGFDARVEHQYELKKFGYKYTGLVDDSLKVVNQGIFIANYLGFYARMDAASHWAEFDNYFVRVHPSFYEPWNSYDTDLWTSPLPDGVSVSSGILTATATNTDQNRTESTETFLYKSLKARVKFTRDGTSAYANAIGFRSYALGKYAFLSVTNLTMQALTADGGTNEVEDIRTITADTYYNVEIQWKSGEVKFYVDGVLEATHTIYAPTTNALGVYVRAWGDTSETTYVDVDWIKVERAEPTITPAVASLGWKPLTDSETLAEDYDNKPVKSLSETINLSEADTREVTIIKTDSITGVETLNRTVARDLTDAVTETDSISKTPKRNLTDSITETDSISKTPVKSLSDNTTIVDSTAIKTPSKNISDSINLTEADTRGIIKVLTDLITGIESFVRKPKVIKTDSLIESDSISKIPLKPLTDGITETETIYKTPIKKLSDSETFTDGDNKTITRILSDSITGVETFAKNVSRNLTDGISEIESILKNPKKTLSDSVSLLETFSAGRMILKTLTDSISLVESFSTSKIILKTLTDSISMTENIVKKPKRIFSDSISLIERYVNKFLSFIAVTVQENETHKVTVQENETHKVTVQENETFTVITKDYDKVI